jgi:hypothetical protein
MLRPFQSNLQQMVGAWIAADMSREGIRNVVVRYTEEWVLAHGALPSGTHAIPVRRSRAFSELVQLDFDTLAVDVASSAFGETR